MPSPRGKHSRVLLVEGRDDREVIYQFCNRHGIDNRGLFEVEDKVGYGHFATIYGSVPSSRASR
jgi:hypothetical protein